MWHAAQHSRSTRSARGRNDNEVAQAFQQIFDEPTRILPGLDNPVNGVERGSRITATKGVDGLVEQGCARVTQQRDGALIFDGLSIGTGHELVEQ